MNDDDSVLTARPKKLSFRVNGTRIGEPARPVAAATHLPTRRAPLRIHAALSTRPNDYMPDDDGSEVAS